MVCCWLPGIATNLNTTTSTMLLHATIAHTAINSTTDNFVTLIEQSAADI